MTGHAVVCVPAFADSAASWRPLVHALAADRREVVAIDLPGFGGTPAPPTRPDIESYVDHVVRMAREAGHRRVTLVGHSLGAAIAVRAAHRLADRCAALVSLEGNLTPEDAYFSGQAADYDDPAAFQRAFIDQVDRLVLAGRVPVSYATAVRDADANCMWSLGRDAAVLGADGTFGREFRDLAMPTRYLWSTATTPPATREYLRRHRLSHRRLDVPHHWPWTLAPELVAGAIAEPLDIR